MKAKRFQAPVTVRLEGKDEERVRKSHAGCILELQSVPIVGGRLVRDVELAFAVDTVVAHGLGRRASVFVSPPRGGLSSGRILEKRTTAHDPDKYVVLFATGWSETITVDLWLF